MDGPWLVSYLALWALVLLLVVLVLGLAREVGTLLRRFGAPGALMTQGGLEIGQVAPDFTATEIRSGREVAFQAAGERAALLVFVAPNCAPCEDLLPQLAAAWDEWQHRARLHVLCEGDEALVRAVAERTASRYPLLADPLARIRQDYGQPPTPFAFLVDEGGVVRLKGIVNSRDELDRMLDGQARVYGGRDVIVSGTPIEQSAQRKEMAHGQTG